MTGWIIGGIVLFVVVSCVLLSLYEVRARRREEKEAEERFARDNWDKGL